MSISKKFKIAKPPMIDAFSAAERRMTLSRSGARFYPAGTSASVAARTKSIVRKILEAARIGVQ